MEISILVCDVCKDPSLEVTRYTVTANDVTGSTDRCQEHGQPLALVLEGRGAVAEPPRPRPRPARAQAPRPETPAPRRGGRKRVMSMDDIEQAKRHR